MSSPKLVYNTYVPPAFLKNYVVEFWSLEVCFEQGNEPLNHRLCAQAYPDLVFGRTGIPTFSAISSLPGAPSLELMGANTTYRSFTIDKEYGLTGMTLYPVAVSTVFGLNPGELKDQRYEAEELLGPSVKDLKDKLAHADSVDKQIELLGSFLYEKIIASPADDLFTGCMNFIEKANGRVDLKQLADKSGLSRRHFERKFLQHTGITPHLYSRLLKFRSALMGQTNIFHNLADLAYHLDYCDQSHFIREFKAFSGESPKILLKNPHAENLFLL